MKLKINLPLARARPFPDLSFAFRHACIARCETRQRDASESARRLEGGGAGPAEVLYDNVKLDYTLVGPRWCTWHERRAASPMHNAYGIL